MLRFGSTRNFPQSAIQTGSALAQKIPGGCKDRAPSCGCIAFEGMRHIADMPVKTSIDRRLNVAPMMDWTDRHCRYFHRLLSPSAVLYTEMVTTAAVLHGDRDRLLGFNAEEHPVALQLGGSDPAELAECAAIAAARGYDEINLNVGCPSDRVQKGRFGACLMLEPQTVGDGVAAMRAAVDIPVTVKTRLGVDQHDSFACFGDFIHQVAQSGCSTFIIHARKAWLSGLSPKENRDVPALRHDWVYRLKQENPQLTLILNGGVQDSEQALAHMQRVDGVMLGRAAYHQPWLLHELEQALASPAGDASRAVRQREDVVQAMVAYARRQREEYGVPVKQISRHMLGLFQGLPGGRLWRRYIAEHAHLEHADENILIAALQPLLSHSAPCRDAA